MTIVDWNAPATLLERSDGGSELYFDFQQLGSGTLAALVARVAAMPPADISRLLIDSGTAGMLTVAQIMALAAREDFPGAPGE